MARKPLYPWDVWLNGKIHKLKPERDFHVSVPTLRVAARQAAKSRGLKVKIETHKQERNALWLPDDFVYLHATKAE